MKGDSWTKPPPLHYYTVPIQPTTPLRVGLRVRLLALSRVAYHQPRTAFPWYEAYDPHVAGSVVAVTGGDGEMMMFELANECELNSVRRVRLIIRSIPEITTSVPYDIPYVGGLFPIIAPPWKTVLRLPSRHPTGDAQRRSVRPMDPSGPEYRGRLSRSCDCGPCWPGPGGGILGPD